MKTTDQTIQSKTYGTITREQAIEILRQRIADQASQPRTLGLSNGTPKGGWTETDRVAK